MCIRDRYMGMRPQWFLAKDYDVECFEEEHFHFLFTYGIPCILVYIIGAPLFAWFRVRSRFLSKNLYSPDNLSPFAFLYYGYKEEVYFWEFIIFARKLLLVLTLIIVPHTAIQIQTLTVLLILAIAYGLHSYYKPFLSDELNRLERFSLISSALMIYSGVYLLAYSREGDTTHIQRAIIIYFSIMIFALGLFWIPWILSYRRVVENMIQRVGLERKVNKFIDFLKGVGSKSIQPKAPERMSEDGSSQSTNSTTQNPFTEKKETPFLPKMFKGSSIELESKTEPKNQ
eukprot:TRINITY_DN4046_c0_g1_i5.p1 TRINITY_DN4046_c0_g1~~TRINITY_DN4046_c0_g1_i5.p1  ORF type:complete len:306 (+),score=40.20 TRINITY_DN4046_c0_g1_i5:62-919(+)